MQESFFDFIQCSTVTDFGFPESDRGRISARHAPGAPQSLPAGADSAPGRPLLWSLAFHLTLPGLCSLACSVA